MLLSWKYKIRLKIQFRRKIHRWRKIAEREEEGRSRIHNLLTNDAPMPPPPISPQHEVNISELENNNNTNESLLSKFCDIFFNLIKATKMKTI